MLRRGSRSFVMAASDTRESWAPDSLPPPYIFELKVFFDNVGDLPAKKPAKLIALECGELTVASCPFSSQSFVASVVRCILRLGDVPHVSR